MGVIGPTPALERLARQLRGIDGALARTPRDLANKAAVLTRLSANAQRSADGAAWQRGPATSPQVGRKSGAMLGNIRGVASGMTFSVRVGRRYAWFFQHGAIHRGPRQGTTAKSGPLRPGERRRRVKNKGRERGFQQPRPIVPNGDAPPHWVAQLEGVIDTRIRAHLAL